jgi:tetratricopeptide (TPR) repeat protein
MKQAFQTGASLLFFFLFLSQGIAQKKTMTWTTSSKEAKEIANKGAAYMMNIEFAQAYQQFEKALELDPNFTVVLTLMTNLSNGEAKKKYAERAFASAKNKTAGEQLFVKLVTPENKQADNQKIWADLYAMFPDGSFIGFFYTLSRPTPAEQFTAAEEYLKKFPDAAPIHNILGYLYLQEKKDNATAKKHFEKYIELYPTGCNPYDSFGEFYFITGDMDNAEKYYQLALEKYPFNTSSIEKLKEIKMAKSKAKAD